MQCVALIPLGTYNPHSVFCDEGCCALRFGCCVICCANLASFGNFSEICVGSFGLFIFRKIRKVMKYRIILLLAFAGILVSSCVKENLPADGGSILALMENDDTKTSVTDEGVFTWSTGDNIWLHTTSGSVVGTLSSGAGTASANFSYGAYFGEMTGKAVYPYNSGHAISGDELSVVMPSAYDLGSNLTNTNAAMYGVVSDGRLKFNHLAGVMRFKFKNVPAGVNKFTLTLDKKINGTFIADLTKAYPVIETSETSTASEKTITLNFTALTETADIALYVPLPLGTYNSLELGLYVGNQSVWTYSNAVSNTISRKSLILMPTVTLGGTIGGEIEGDDSIDGEIEGNEPVESEVIDLSEDGTANSYIVSEAGAYRFTPTKGNSNESVGAIASAEVLWETFGTDVTPNVGDLVTNVKYENGMISFETPSTYNEGNAVIAAKDADGNILWSWHIWLTDQPQGQEYYNNAGTMMDRNLGATSATPGDVGALGLLYQWGRKDPFLGSSSISSSTLAKSTLTWPSAVTSNSSRGTVSYVTANPTTFVYASSSPFDWHYSSRDNSLWTTSESTKSIYDPCPSGWRVPDGGSNGVWSKALSSTASYSYDSSNEGYDFSEAFGSSSIIWCPASGCRYYSAGSLVNVGYSGHYWSASPSSSNAYFLLFNYSGSVTPSRNYYRADGQSVRCLQEQSISVDQPAEPEVVNLSEEGTANSYIVSEAGAYKFTPTKGNSNESVGAIASAEVLWETFGTDVTPNVGDLVTNVEYENGMISFETHSTYNEGNAVIAAKDANGNILWSWHIWLTDQPQGQEYFNNAGTMMDRNLGATSATPGDVGALGLLYQWGRKDPFLGSSSISSYTLANSTITWPSAVSSDSSNGTIAYATADPTTFIGYNSSNYDWYYTGSSSTDNTRWTTSESTKSIYDPCPAGWRVPDGGSNGVWSKALGSSSSFTQSTLYDSTNEGMNFSGQFGSDQTIWYPASGYRSYGGGGFANVGDYGYSWSASPYGNNAYYLYFSGNGLVNPSYNSYRAYGRSVRCLQVIDEVAEP